MPAVVMEEAVNSVLRSDDLYERELFYNEKWFSYVLVSEG